MKTLLVLMLLAGSAGAEVDMIAFYATSRREAVAYCYESMAKNVRIFGDTPSIAHIAIVEKYDKDGAVEFEYRREFKTCEDLPQKSLKCSEDRDDCWLVRYREDSK